MCKARALAAISLPLVMCLSGFLIGCSPFQQPGGEDNQEVLTLNLEADIPDLNSTTATDLASFNVLNNVMEGLYRLDENDKPQPAMAESVEISDDKLTYTFKLREGIEWSNGEPLTSQDFRYAWLRAMDPATAGEYSHLISDFVKGGAEFAAGEAERDSVAIETPDETTLEVTLANPTPFFLDLTTADIYFPLNQAFVEQQGDEYAQSADALLYNGPYTLSEFSPATGVTFEKNQSYWDKENVDIEQVKGRVIKEEDTAVNLYEAGELDVVLLSAEYVEQYRDSPEFITQPEFATSYIVMNQQDPVFRNQSIRRAIQIGFDRQALTHTVLNRGEPADGLVPTGIAGADGQTFREAAGRTTPEFNAERARELYEQGSDELGREPTLELLVADVSVSRDVATFVQSQFEENLGATVAINQQPFDQFLELLHRGDYQLAGYSFGADYNDPTTLLNLYRSDSPLNVISFQNERYDRLISDAKMEADPRRRLEMLIEAETILLEEEAALAPSYYTEDIKLVKPHVKGYREHPYGAELELKLVEIEE